MVADHVPIKYYCTPGINRADVKVWQRQKGLGGPADRLRDHY